MTDKSKEVVGKAVINYAKHVALHQQRFPVCPTVAYYHREGRSWPVSALRGYIKNHKEVCTWERDQDAKNSNEREAILKLAKRYGVLDDVELVFDGVML